MEYRGDGMLNEKRVKHMIRMAMYESKEGEQDFKISAYYQKDYASLNTWITAVWTTIGYLILVGVFMLFYMETILDHANLAEIAIIVGGILIGYLMTLVVSVIMSYEFYRKKHIEARKRVKKFNHDLIVLSKMYEKEIK